MKRLSAYKQLFTALLLLNLSLPAATDQLELANGDRITGTILSMTEKSLRLKTGYGIIEIPRQEILRGQFGDPLQDTGQEVAAATNKTLRQLQLQPQAAAVTRKGLILELLFNGDFNDTSGSINSLKLANNVFFIEGADGKAAGAVLSDGTGTYLEVKNSNTLSALNSFSLSLWVLIQAETASQYLAAKWEKTSGKTADGKFALSYSQGNLYFYIVDDQANYYGLKTKAEIIQKTWHHITACFHDSRMSLYLDGQLLAEQTVPVSKLLAEKSPLYLMTAKAFTAEGWAYYNLIGRLDNVRLYNRQLSNDEIAVLYNEVNTGP